MSVILASGKPFDRLPFKADGLHIHRLLFSFYHICRTNINTSTQKSDLSDCFGRAWSRLNVTIRDHHRSVQKHPKVLTL